MYWIVFSDLDGTLWDHMDVSSLTPPFKRIDKKTIVDSNGIMVRIYNDTVYLLTTLRKCGAIVSSLSWNEPHIALEVIDSLGLNFLFDYHLIANHPFKYILATQLLSKLRAKYHIEPELVVYLDDRDIHLPEMRSFIANLLYLRPWVEFRTYTEAIQLISVYTPLTTRMCLLRNIYRKDLY